MTNPDRIAKGLYWDEAWSLVSGCTPVSPGCDRCWSARETHMRANNPNDKVRARAQGLTNQVGCFNGGIRLNNEFLDKPLRKRKPTVFAVWTDLFHPDVPFDFILRAWMVMARSRQHTFLVLTKRPEIMNHLLSFQYQRLDLPLPNVWLGTTAENQAMADERIPLLLQTPAAVRWVSVEPMLGPVDLEKTSNLEPRDCSAEWLEHLDWVVCGGESGHGARPMHPDWVRSLRDQCQAAGVPFLFKQWGEWAPFYDRDVEDPDWRNIPEQNYSSLRRLNLAGGEGFHGDRVVYCRKVGKKAAGRLLDGRTWDEFPEVKHA